MLKNYLENIDFGQFKIEINKFHVSSNMELEVNLKRQNRKLFRAIDYKNDIFINIGLLRGTEGIYYFQIDVIKGSNFDKIYIEVTCYELSLLKRTLQFLINLMANKKDE